MKKFDIWIQWEYLFSDLEQLPCDTTVWKLAYINYWESDAEEYKSPYKSKVKRRNKKTKTKVQEGNERHAILKNTKIT